MYNKLAEIIDETIEDEMIEYEDCNHCGDTFEVGDMNCIDGNFYCSYCEDEQNL